MGASSQFNDGVQLKILPTLSEVFLRHLSYCRRQAFQDDGYDKINVKTLSVSCLSLQQAQRYCYYIELKRNLFKT